MTDRGAAPPAAGAAAARSGPIFERAALGVFTRYYRRHARSLAIYTLLATLQSLLVLPLLWQVRLAFDTAIPQARVGLLVALGGGIALVRALQSVVAVALRNYVLGIIKSAVGALRVELLDRLQLLSHPHLARVDRDQLHTRIVQDSERFDNLGHRVWSAVVPALFGVLVLAPVLLYLNAWLVAATAIVAPPLWLLSRRLGRRVKRDVGRFQEAFERFSHGTQFALRHADLTRLHGCEAIERERQHARIAALGDTGRRMAMSFAVHGQAQRNVGGIAGIVILVAGGAAVATGAMTLGQLAVFYVAAGLLNGHLDTLLGSLPELIAGHESLLKLRGLLEEGEVEPYTGTRAIDFNGDVRLVDVAFGYGATPVLRGVDLALRPGVSVAIVGPNGSGKTTLAHLLVGFVRPSCGAILAGDVAYDEIDMRALRSRIGVVTQHPSFFAGSVAENLRYGRPEASDDELVAAARLGLAEDFVRELPEGFDAPIGEGGALLSGGQRQRLAIARALVGQPRLLILDEPTNHLDAASVHRVLVNVLAMPTRPAVLVISHDREVIAMTDEVHALVDGRLAPIRSATAAPTSARRTPLALAP
jgi:ATP-binding cassette subfamily B protein